jgi:hypothetical protein
MMMKGVFPMSKLFVTLLVLAFLVILSSCTSGEETSSTESETETSSPPVLTEYQERLQQTTVDFNGVDFSGDASIAAGLLVDTIAEEMKRTGRFEGLFEKAKTNECRALIAEHFGYFLKAIATETPLPFASTKFDSSCEDEHPWDFNNLPEGTHMGHVQNRTYQPPRNETNDEGDSLYISSDDVVLCYGILAHDSAEATIRIIEAVDEPTTTFVVHIDGKYEENYVKLKEYASNRDRVVVLDHPHRVRVNWGGFR